MWKCVTATFAAAGLELGICAIAGFIACVAAGAGVTLPACLIVVVGGSLVGSLAGAIAGCL